MLVSSNELLNGLTKWDKSFWAGEDYSAGQ